MLFICELCMYLTDVLMLLQPRVVATLVGMWAEGQAYHNLPHLPPGGGGRSAGVDPLALAPRASSNSSTGESKQNLLFFFLFAKSNFKALIIGRISLARC